MSGKTWSSGGIMAGESRNTARGISQRPFVFHKSQMDFPGTEPLVSAVKPRLNNSINVTVHPSCFGPK